MKRQAKFIAQQASMMDRSAAKIFNLTRLTVIITLLTSIGLLILAPFFDSCTEIRLAANGLFHSVFRIAAVGVAAGFAADIIAKRSRR